MNTRHKYLFIITAVMTALITVAPTSNAKGRTPISPNDRVIKFWTNKRIAAAVPRDFELNARTGRFQLRGKPTNPDTVLGASWTGGGVVAESTGKVFFSLGTSYYSCSASVVTDAVPTRSIIVTAGHCAYDEVNNQFAQNWIFVPAYDASPASFDTDGLFCDSTAYGCWVAQSLVVSNEFAAAETFNVTAAQHDYAFAVVGAGGKSDLQLDQIVGTQFVETSGRVEIETDSWIFGYPAAGKYKGNDLMYCRNLLYFDGRYGVDWSTYKLACGMTAGSSGGPWFRQFSMIEPTAGMGTIFSVTSYSYGGTKNLYGPMLDIEAAQMLQVASTTNSNVLYSLNP